MRTCVLLCLLSGCGFSEGNVIQYEKCFDLNQPIEVATPGLEAPPLVLEAVPKLFAHYIASLGGSVTATKSDNPRIYVLNAEKYENKCDNSELGYIQNNQPTIIYMCKSSYKRSDWLTYMIAHELGHVLGSGHSDCADHTIMSPSFVCVPEGNIEYFAMDVASICNSGYVTRGVCGPRRCKESKL